MTSARAICVCAARTHRAFLPLLSIFPLSDYHIAFQCTPSTASSYNPCEKGACVGEGWEGKESHEFNFPSRGRYVTQKFLPRCFLFPSLPPLCLEACRRRASPRGTTERENWFRRYRRLSHSSRKVNEGAALLPVWGETRAQAKMPTVLMGGMEGGEERFCPKEGREGEKTMRASRASLKSAASSALCATAPFTLTTTAVAAVARSTTLRRCSSLLPTHRSEFRARLGEFPKKRRRNVPDSLLGRAALAAPSIRPASATFVTRKPQRNQASPAGLWSGRDQPRRRI